MTGLILYMYEAYMYEAEEISYLHKVKTKDHFLSISTYLIKYAPANLQRTPNFWFIGPLTNSSALGYGDSKELFSLGRVDYQWLNRSATRVQ